MQRVPFGDTGATVARLGIGALDVTREQAAAARLVERMLDAGCDLIDTAACYPGHEEFLGRHLAHRRDDFLLVSKCGHHQELPGGGLRSPPVSMADVDAALRRLRTDRLDAMLLHSYDLAPLQRGEALAVLERAREQGKLRWPGYAGDAARAAWAADHPAVRVLECSLSLVDQHNLDQVLPGCRAHGVGVIAKKPLANAAWRFVDRPAEAHPAVRLYVTRMAALDLAPSDYGCADLAELALRFVLAQTGVHCAIVGCADPAHQDANLTAAERGPLPPAAADELRTRFCEAETASGESWPACN